MADSDFEKAVMKRELPPSCAVVVVTCRSAAWASASTGRRRGLVFVLAIVLLATPACVQARSLSTKLHRFFDTMGVPAPQTFAENVTPIIKRLALRGVDFPVTSTSPGFTYRFNFELGAPERSTESFGPVFVERPETVGQYRLDLSIAYLWANLTDFEGAGLGRQIVTRGQLRLPPRTTLQQDFVGKDFSLMTHEVLLSATYGVTSTWDVNILQPIIRNTLRLSGLTRASASTPEGSVSVGGQMAFEATAFGLGDTLLRTKYRLSEGRPVSVAAALSVRLPVGDENDVHGLGDTIVTPSLVVSRSLGPHEVHGSVGIDFNADDTERHRARYAFGASFRPFEHLALLFDIIGNSPFADDTFDISAPVHRVFPQSFGLDVLVKSRGLRKIVAFVPRGDVIDYAFGLKVNVPGNILGFANVIVPLTDDGLRAELIPAVGIERSF